MKNLCTKNNLYAHLKTHFDKPFQCSFCEKSFTEDKYKRVHETKFCHQMLHQQQQHQPDLDFIFDNPQIHHQQQQKPDLQAIFDDILDNQQVQQQQQHQPDLDQILTENISSAEG